MKNSKRNFKDSHLGGMSQFVVLLLGLALLLIPTGVALADGPTLTTDKSIYYIGEVATITGSGFTANALYDIPVIRPDGSIVKGDGSLESGWDTVQADENGAFTYKYQVLGIEGFYTANVYPSPWDPQQISGAGAPLAQIVIQAVQVQHNHFQNVQNGGEWAEGDINTTNSDYAEGDSIPERYEIIGLGTSSKYVFLTINYQFQNTSGPDPDPYAFDFLTDYDITESPGLFDDSPKSSLSSGDCDTSALAIPDDASHTFDNDFVTANGTQYFTICHDGTSMTASIPDSNDPTLVSGDEKEITLRLETDADEIAIFWGGHLARASDWGVGWGASSISGAPYHQTGDGFVDENKNSQKDPTEKTLTGPDRSVNSVNSEPTGTIIIKKVTDPAGGTNFGFTDDIIANDSFTLDDGDTEMFSNVPIGSYTVTEDDPTPDFDLTGLVCEEDQGNSTTDKDTRTATINLDANETVECTFTNTQRGTILINKVTEPAGGTGFSFGYTAIIGSVNMTGTFSLDDGDTEPFSNVPPSSWTVTEDDPGPGYKLTDLVCEEDQGDNSTTDKDTRTAIIDLDPGETVECTFTNEKQKPAAISLASFEVQVNESRPATIIWETAAETDNAGFNLYRASYADGPWVKINSALIKAEGDPVTGARYTFTDTPGRGTFYYRLEDIDFYGVNTLHAPVLADLGAPIRVPCYRPLLPFLDLIVASGCHRPGITGKSEVGAIRESPLQILFIADKKFFKIISF